jgi:integrase
MMKVKLTTTLIKRLKPSHKEYTVWDLDTPYFGVRVWPTGVLRFIHIITTKDGRQVKTTIGDAARMPLKKARAEARGLTVKFREGGFDKEIGKVDMAPTSPTFGYYVSDVWWPLASPYHKPTTRKREKQALDRQLLPALGEYQLEEITREVILKWFDEYSSTSPGGANRALDVLSSILSHAKKAGIIPRNPVFRVRRNLRRRMTRFLSAVERENLLRELDAVPEHSRVKALLFKMLLYTGCRLNEITGLLWTEIGEGVINLKDSKTGPRQVWLEEDEIAILDELKALQEATGGISKFVFAHPKDKGRSVGSCSTFWRNIKERAGLKDFRVHDLRHSFASEAVRQGVSLPVLMKLLGHSDIKMVLRYVHASNDEAEAAAERNGERLISRLQGEG